MNTLGGKKTPTIKKDQKNPNSAWNGSVSFWKKISIFFWHFVFSKVPEDSDDCIHWKALVSDSDLFKTNIKSHCVIFMHLNATSSEFFHEIFICPYL